MSKILAFDQAYENLQQAGQQLSRALFWQSLQRCVANYSVDNLDMLETQIQRVAEVVWHNNHLPDSSLLQLLLKPYVNKEAVPNLTSFFSHVDIIRTCLDLAKFIDDERAMLAEERLIAALDFLLTVLPKDINADNFELILPHVAVALVGNQWQLISTLYDVPEESVTSFRKALHALPSSILVKPESVTTRVTLPDSVIT